LKSDYLPDVSICATILLSQLETDLVCFVIPLVDWEARGFTVMAEMGFFVLTGQRYQMVIPSRLTVGKVKKAGLKLAQTEDESRISCRHHAICRSQSMASSPQWDG
jgi:hypothetical protein